MRNLHYREIVDQLPIDKHRLDDALEVQSEIQFIISDCMTAAREVMELKKHELDTVEAQLFRQIANHPDGKRGPNLDFVKSTVKSDTQRTEKWLDYNAARVEFEKWEGLYYAWRSRSDALKALASLAVSNYFVVDSVYKENLKNTRGIVRRRL